MYADGGSRGNPGPSGSGSVLFDLKDGKEGDVLAEVNEFIGHATNNQAEYHAIVIGLKKAKELGIQVLDVRLDSELAVKQLNGEYRVKNQELAKKFLEIHHLKPSFREIRFSHVPRARNAHADRLVNEAIDQGIKS